MTEQQSNASQLLVEEAEITALYLRVARKDKTEGESSGIANQQAFLKEYARKHGFQNLRVFIDNGVSGATLNRSGFQEMMALIEAGKVKTVIVKDMSRLSRNYIEMGQLTETVFPQHNVRLIAVNDGVDSAQEDKEFFPPRNLMLEWALKHGLLRQAA